MESQLPTPVRPGVVTEAAKIDKAMTLAGQVVTDGNVMGVLDSVDGETWSVTVRDGEAMLHSHTGGSAMPEYRKPECALIVQVLLKGYDRTYVDSLTLVRPLSSLRKGVTLAKATDLPCDCESPDCTITPHCI